MMWATKKICECCGEEKLMRWFPLIDPRNEQSIERGPRCSRCDDVAWKKYSQAHDGGKIKRRKKRATKQPGYFTEKSSRRRAAKYAATPRWVNRGVLLLIYRKAAIMTKKTGIVYHVDHIVPLQHERVCGLHIPINLRIIPATENLTKRNKFEEDKILALPNRPLWCDINS